MNGKPGINRYIAAFGAQRIEKFKAKSSTMLRASFITILVRRSVLLEQVRKWKVGS